MPVFLFFNCKSHVPKDSHGEKYYQQCMVEDLSTLCQKKDEVDQDLKENLNNSIC